jgi:hypothetical protein
MPAGIKQFMSVSAIAFIAVSTLSSSANADTNVIPNMTMSITTDQGSSVFNPAEYGNAWGNPNGTFSFLGSKGQQGNYGLGWSMLVNPDPFVIANFVVTNNSAFDQTFTITVTLPTNSGGLNSFIGGSVTGSVTDLNGNGATLSSPAAGSIYGAIIDNNVVETLLDDPFSVSTGAFQSNTVGPASFGDPIPNQPYLPLVTTNIGITLSFVLSAGDSASFTSIFVVEYAVIPGPAGLAMLGLAGLFAGARRRRA